MFFSNYINSLKQILSSRGTYNYNIVLVPTIVIGMEL